MSLAAIAELNAKMKAAHEEIAKIAKAEGANIIKELFAPLWETGIVATAWTQYTPYFNDGEPCEFSVYAEPDEMPVTWAGGPDFEGGYSDEASLWYAKYAYEPFVAATYRSTEDNERYRLDQEAKKARYIALGVTLEKIATAKAVLKEITKVLNQNEGMLKSAFGDHVQVRVTPDGVEVEEYDHD